ncbi:MAG TPA: hypothetical protein VJ951_04025 [Bacteroidales bacterium]|nr:hypothetical protein [Bacteroidales bacterium]
MMKNNDKPFLNMDERNKQIALKVIAMMYFFTFISLLGIMFYKQFTLGKTVADFEAVAILVTVNVIFLISALLFFGALPIRRLKFKNIIVLYIVFVLMGSIFTYVKYNIVQKANLSVEQLAGKLFIIFTLTALLMGFWMLFSYLGKRKIEKELNE